MNGYLTNEYVDSVDASRIDAQERINLEDEINRHTGTILSAPPLEPATVAEAYLDRGLAHAKLGNYSFAIGDLSVVIERDIHREIAFRSRGIAYAKVGDYNHAIADYTQAITLRPDDATSYYNRGVAYTKMGDYDRALGDFTQAVILRPNDGAIYHTRGVTFYRKGDLIRGIEDFTAAIERNPDYVIAHSARGIMHLHLQAWAEAKADLTTARNMGVNIINEFHSEFANVEDFEEQNNVTLPDDIAAMLTLPQDE